MEGKGYVFLGGGGGGLLWFFFFLKNFVLNFSGVARCCSLIKGCECHFGQLNQHFMSGLVRINFAVFCLA